MKTNLDNDLHLAALSGVALNRELGRHEGTMLTLYTKMAEAITALEIRMRDLERRLAMAGCDHTWNIDGICVCGATRGQEI